MRGHPFRDGDAPLEHARDQHARGVAAWQAARFDDAGEALRAAYAIRRRIHGEDHDDTLATLERLAALAHYTGDFDVAAIRFDKVVTKLVARHGDGSIRVAIARRNQAALLRDRHRLDEARLAIDSARGVLERALPGADPELVAALKVDALLHLFEGSPAAAHRVGQRALALGRKRWPDDHPLVVAAELIVATAETRLGELKTAAKRFPRIVAALEAAYGEHPLVAIALGQQARLALAAGSELERAEHHARRALELYRRTYPTKGQEFARTLFEILCASERYVDAAELAFALEPELDPRSRQWMAAKLANAFVKRSAFEDALPWLARARDGADDPAVREQWASQHARWERYVRRFEQPER